MDDPKKRGRADRERIAVTEDHEVRYWTGALNCTHAELVAAVQAVGPMAKNVKAHLAR